MIVVTGANGMIGSNLLATLETRGGLPLLAVDVLPSLVGMHEPASRAAEVRYAVPREATRWLDMESLEGWLERQGAEVRGIVHLGALSDTTLTDRARVLQYNLHYTQALWRAAAAIGCPFVYASSAATYGDGSLGYDDRTDPASLRPLNLYAESKHAFDLWALEQSTSPPRWAGLKYFNVYGPNEAHKRHMASVAYHAFHQVCDTGRVRLFQSHRPDTPHGHQRRDFVSVADAVDATLHLFEAEPSPSAPNGLYNIGTGRARTFEDVALAVFAACEKPVAIDYVPMPETLRNRYQYFTQATIEKLRQSGFAQPMATVEQGVRGYVCYLMRRRAA